MGVKNYYFFHQWAARILNWPWKFTIISKRIEGNWPRVYFRGCNSFKINRVKFSENRYRGSRIRFRVQEKRLSKCYKVTALLELLGIRFLIDFFPDEAIENQGTEG